MRLAHRPVVWYPMVSRETSSHTRPVLCSPECHELCDSRVFKTCDELMELSELLGGFMCVCRSLCTPPLMAVDGSLFKTLLMDISEQRYDVYS